MRSTRPRVLVLDGMWNKALACVRSLGKRGLFVTAGEVTRLCTALFSRYASRRAVYPSPVARPDDFMAWLMRELREQGHCFVLPSEFSTQQVIASHAGEISGYVRYPFPEFNLARNVHNKAYLMAVAIERKYPAPNTWFVREGAELSAVRLANEITYPAVIKPTHSSGSRGVAYAKDRYDFIVSYMRVHAKYPYPLVQEYIPCGKGGGGFGVGALFNFESKPVAAFVYRRLREYPVSGGPSTLRESVKWDELRDTALRILSDLRWVGPAMVEFRLDERDGVPKLLEINPRLWGSLQLAVLSGVDFPYLMYKLATDGDVEPVFDYKAGVRCRWLIPGDFMHMVTNPERFSALRGFMARTDGDDIISIGDPLPIAGRVLSILPFLYKKDLRRLIKR